jgi:hypothetical protein
MGRWPDPVRDPLPVGRISEADIGEALALTVRFLLDPEDPAFDIVAFAALGAARAALIECLDVLELARIDRELHGRGDRREWERIGEEMVARKVARRVIDDLRRWLPED